MDAIDPSAAAEARRAIRKALDRSLEELRAAVARHEAEVGRGRSPSPGAPEPDSPRAAALDVLCRAMALRTGIRVEGAVAAKLGRVLDRVDARRLALWVEDLAARDADDPEWLALIESLTVHETYFFRDPGQLALLAEMALPELVAAAARRERRLDVWSAGCATGEEAYTLAILALEALEAAGHAREEAGFGIRPAPGWSLTVIGTDIARPPLIRAADGVYQTGPLSPFRQMPARAERFFPERTVPDDPGAGMVRVARDDLRDVSVFTRANLIEREPPGTAFDLVACRNVLIYLTEPARRAVLTRVASAVRPGGWLLLGPTDRLIGRGPEAVPGADTFEQIWHAGSVAYRRREDR